MTNDYYAHEWQEAIDDLKRTETALANADPVFYPAAYLAHQTALARVGAIVRSRSTDASNQRRDEIIAQMGGR